MSQTVIEFKNVDLGFDNDLILKNVNFTINEGDIFTLIGPSGSGKSLILKTMAGIYKPLSGHVLIEGENIETLSPEKRSRLARHLGMQFQKSALFDSMTVFENVAFPLREQGHFEEGKINERVMDCLTAVNLSSASHLYPHEISGGMKQRLGIARAIAMKPTIVLYDDPTAGLDPIHTDKIVDLIIDLKKKNNSTMVIVTHSMDVAYRLNGQIALVLNQEVLVTGNATETQNHPDPRVQQFTHGYLKGPIRIEQ